MLRRALDRGLAAAGQHHERTAGRRARRRDVAASTVGDHWLAVQQLPEQRQLFVGEPAPSTHVDAELLVLLGAVADAERVDTRPLLMMSSTLMSSASRTGSQNGRTTAASMIGSRSVRAAIADANTSGDGR